MAKEQPAFCDDVLPLVVDETVAPFSGVKRFDLKKTIEEREDSRLFLPLLSRKIELEDIPGKLTVYGDIPSKDFPLHIDEDPELKRYFRLRRWTNRHIPINSTGLDLTLAVHKSEELELLMKYYLDINIGAQAYTLDCNEGHPLSDLWDALGDSSNKAEIPNLQLWDIHHSRVDQPLPPHLFGLSLMKITLRKYPDAHNPKKLPTDPRRRNNLVHLI